MGDFSMISRRRALGLVATGVPALLLSRAASAADYPTRPVRFLVGYPPGGATDILARLIGQRLSERLGQQFLIENKPGAGNNIATEAAVNAAPDGYTVLLVNPANFINTSLYTNLKFNFVTDIAPVAAFNRVPNVMTVNKDVPAKNVAEFIAYAKANPGKINMASSGNGTSVHLSGEMFMAMTGVKMQHVPYRGAAPAITDLLGGQVAMMVTSSASIEPMAADKKARVLGTFTAKPLANFAGVPTMNEAANAKNLEVPVWVGVLAPAKTPQAVIDKLAKEIDAICRESDTQERFKTLGALATCGGPKELAKVVADDDARWGKVIKQGNIKSE
jgi:tripartite-type tricarboxylate transporter receptor subunit TctC